MLRHPLAKKERTKKREYTGKVLRSFHRSGEGTARGKSNQLTELQAERRWKRLERLTITRGKKGTGLLRRKLHRRSIIEQRRKKKTRVWEAAPTFRFEKVTQRSLIALCIHGNWGVGGKEEKRIRSGAFFALKWDWWKNREGGENFLSHVPVLLPYRRKGKKELGERRGGTKTQRDLTASKDQYETDTKKPKNWGGEGNLAPA